MTRFFYNLGESVTAMLLDSSFLLIIGILLAGLLHLLLTDDKLKKFLRGSKNGVVLKTALFGIPLPLCSCSVLPMAHQLRQSGLNKGATAAFLISTPETGVDSILLTYSLTDPLMTAARPISAFLTSLTAGFLINNSKEPDIIEKVETSDCSSCCEDESVEIEKSGWKSKIVTSIKYSFNTLLYDLAPYLFFGYILAGLAAVLLGSDVTTIPDYLRTGWGGYVGAVVVGLPMYICATSSTPLGAVLLASGFSPGAILVFLLVGPATNLATLTVVGKILKRSGMIYYLVIIVIMAVLSGLCLDFIYDYFNFRPDYRSGEHRMAMSIVNNLSALLLGFFIIYYSLKKLIKKIA